MYRIKEVEQDYFDTLDDDRDAAEYLEDVYYSNYEVIRVLKEKYSLFYSYLQPLTNLYGVINYKILLNYLESKHSHFFDMFTSRYSLENNVLFDRGSIYLKYDTEDWTLWVDKFELIRADNSRDKNAEYFYNIISDMDLEAFYPFMVLLGNDVDIANLDVRAEDAKYITTIDAAFTFSKNTYLDEELLNIIDPRDLKLGECLVIAQYRDVNIAFGLLEPYIKNFNQEVFAFVSTQFSGTILGVLFELYNPDKVAFSANISKMIENVDLSVLIYNYAIYLNAFSISFVDNLEIMISKATKKQLKDLLLASAENGVALISQLIMKDPTVAFWTKEDLQYVLTSSILGGIASEALTLDLLNDPRVDLRLENQLGGEIFYHLLEGGPKYRNRILSIILRRNDVDIDNLKAVLDIYPDEKVVEETKRYFKL